MGGLCSKGSIGGKDPVNYYGGGKLTPPQVQVQVQVGEKQLDEPTVIQVKESVSFREERGYGSSDDEFYDGIPRFSRAFSQKSRSSRSKQASAGKVSEVSSRLGRAGSLGLEKAVDVLDTLGSSMANLNTSSGFVSGVTTKGNELSILAFEVANTIVKGYSLMLSLSKRNIRQLKELVLPSEGVQHLVSIDMDELLKVVGADKREELKIFAGEVVRFGNRCKDPQWHNLDLYFEKHSREPPRQLKEEADAVMQQLMTLVQYTAELYHALHTMDRLEQNQHSKYQEADNSNATQRGDAPPILRAELKSQRKQVRSLKKKSLWSRSMEEVMEKLVDIVLFLNWEIQNAFGSADGNTTSNGSLSFQQRLGPAGLDLHYANIVLQIDSIVARSNSMPPNSRDSLYQSLPPNMKSSLRSKLQSFHVKEELTVTEIKAEMEKTLHWLAPIATNTAKAHHGFGWVGEWANTGSEANRKPSGMTDIIRIDTLHYADKGKTEAYILDLVLWLNHLISQTKAVGNNGVMRSPIKSPIRSMPPQGTNQQPTLEDAASTTPSHMPRVEDQEEMLIRGISKSQDLESMKNSLEKHDELSKSSGQSPIRESSDFIPAKGQSPSIPVIDSGLDKEKASEDMIDRVGADTHTQTS